MLSLNVHTYFDPSFVLFGRYFIVCDLGLLPLLCILFVILGKFQKKEISSLATSIRVVYNSCYIVLAQ